MATTTPSSSNQFLMMMYKGMVLRKRHYFRTFCELAIAILVISVPVIINVTSGGVVKDLRRSKINMGHNATIYKPFSPFNAGFNPESKIYFLYAPKTNISELLVNRSVGLFTEKHHIEVRYEIKAFDSQKDLTDSAMAAMVSGAVVIGTVFTNFPSTQSPLPKSLQYKIIYGDAKSYGDFNTDALFKFSVGPRSSNYYSTSLFLPWQASVEQSFISMSSNQEEPNYEVFMLYFPYPPYNDQSPASFMSGMLPVFISGGAIVYFCLLAKQIVEEKANRSKELLKMMGMSNFVYWGSIFVNTYLTAIIICFTASILYTVRLSNGSQVLEYTSGFLLFIVLMLYFAAAILFVLFITTFCPRPVFAIIAVIILFNVVSSLLQSYVFPPDGNSEKFFQLTTSAKLALCLLPNGALQVAFLIISNFEGTEEGANWSNITDQSLNPGINLAMVMVMMLVSCATFVPLLWYADAVWPWQPGVPKPFNFPFTKSYWFSTKKEETDAEDEIPERNKHFFEEVPPGVTPGIVIHKLSKKFKEGMQSKYAVDDVSLNIYSGQITALLGRNGAGKTTTISILTGLFKPSRGSATINGWDIETQTRKARGNLGICPQDNILYDTLTVEEHLKLYAGIKGVKWGNLNEEVLKVMKMLNLEFKRSELSKNLSGGMKRKLSLGIALVGDSKFLFLDEPTSGMDPEARRVLWDLLLRIRHDKTIILTTHYMEEADILGDRIAIMADGKLRCCGSAMFLKRQFGTGYHLHVVKQDVCAVDKITEIIQSFIPELESKETAAELSYVFPGTTSGASLGQMFQKMEVSKESLGIASFGMTVTTMDDVFLKVTVEESAFENMHNDDMSKNSYSSSKESHLDTTSLSNMVLDKSQPTCTSQVVSLVVKRFRYSLRFWHILFPQFIIPFALMCIFLNTVHNNTWNSKMPPELTLNLHSTYGYTKAFYYSQATTMNLANSYTSLLKDNLAEIEVKQDPTSYIIDVGIHDLNTYLKRLMVGATMENSTGTLNFTTWGNAQPLHVTPISLSLAHSALLRYFTGNPSVSIEVTNAPLPNINTFGPSMAMKVIPMMIRIMSYVFVPLALSYLSACYIMVPVHEDSTRAKLLQLMTGVSSFTYWFSMFLWDFFTHIIASALLLIPFAIFTYTEIVIQPQAMGGIFLFYVLFGWCLIPICYLFSRTVKKTSSGFTLIVLLNIATGLLLCIVMFTVQKVTPKKGVNEAIWFLHIFPSFSTTWGLGNLLSLSYANSICDQIPNSILKYMCSTNASNPFVLMCCNDICMKTNSCFMKTNPLAWGDDKCGPELLFLAVGGFVFFGLLILWETSFPRRLLTILKSLSRFRAIIMPPASEPDSDVVRETQRIKDYGPPPHSGEALSTLDLTMVYGNLCAVDSLTFGVRHQECFGLLGVNGAGKTSTFKMLTGDIQPTKGNAFIEVCGLTNQLQKFRSYIGYCPQYDALIDRLTGFETLELFASLKGIPFKERRIRQLIDRIDLTEHANKQTRFYSGGNKRKLSLAIAIISAPPLILLDEPTAGVDPVSRRKIWSVLKEIRNAKHSSILITSHSMEECESICGRLAIMVNGQFRCLGTIQHLKSKYGQGYSIRIKLKKENHNTEAVGIVRSEFMNLYPSAVLRDDNQGMLLFHVSDTSITWSQLFMSLEGLKQALNLEDYLISGTTLEQIFLAFACRQRVSAEKR